MNRRFSALTLFATAAMLCVALAGCTGGSPTTKGSASPEASNIPMPSVTATAPADSALRSRYPAPFNAATAEAETIRLADAIDSLNTKSTTYVDNHNQVVAATANSRSYYGVLRTLTLGQKVDPAATANHIVTSLLEAGWHPLQATVTEGVHVSTLSSGTDVATSWFVVVSGDPTTATQPVVSIALSSPDLP